MSCEHQTVRHRCDGYWVFGSEGYIEAHQYDRPIALLGGEEEPRTLAVDDDLQQNAWVRFHTLLRAATEHDSEVPVTGEDAMKNLGWGLAAYLASDTRCRVDLPLRPEHGDFAGPVVPRTIPATRK